jgi:hypothetical protein
MAAAAAAEELASLVLVPLLPLPLALKILSLLPADARARAACVSRGWRALLDEPSLWARLDLSPASGVTCRVVDAVLAGAAAKARGQLRELDVSACAHVTFDALLAIIRASGGALRELRAGALEYSAQTLDASRMQQLMTAAPQLAALYADVCSHHVTAADARSMLRNEPPFQPLRLRALRVVFGIDADEGSVLSLAEDMAAHTSLKHVDLHGAPLATLAAADTVADAAVACQLVSLSIAIARGLSAMCAPALARLLDSAALTELYISAEGAGQLLDAPAAALLGAALRANTTLTSLSLVNVGLWRDPAAAATLLGALVAHPSLRMLKLNANVVAAAAHEAVVIGAALGALLTADAPALTDLKVSLSWLSDAMMGPLFAALPANTHVRELDVAYNYMTEAFARDVLLPAVRANASLRTLHAQNAYTVYDGVRQAEALVAARGGGPAA